MAIGLHIRVKPLVLRGRYGWGDTAEEFALLGMESAAIEATPWFHYGDGIAKECSSGEGHWATAEGLAPPSAL